LAPVLLALVVGATWLYRRFVPRERRDGRVIGGAVAALVVALLAISASRSALYAAPERPWHDATEKVPGNPRAYDNLAAAIVRADTTRRAEAERLLRRAITVDSTYAPAWTNLAQLEVERGAFADARATLERALTITPEDVDATRRLGGVLLRLGEPQQAI